MHLEFKVPSLMAEKAIASWVNGLSVSPKAPQDEDQSSSGSSTPEGRGSPKGERKEIE